MSTDLKNFWQRLQTGVEVAVAGHTADKLLGVRDAFLRFFHNGLDRTVSVAVVPQPVEDDPVGLPVTDEEVVALARKLGDARIRRYRPLAARRAECTLEQRAAVEALGHT